MKIQWPNWKLFAKRNSIIWIGVLFTLKQVQLPERALHFVEEKKQETRASPCITALRRERRTFIAIGQGQELKPLALGVLSLKLLHVLSPSSSLWELVLQTGATTSSYMLALCSKDFTQRIVFLALKYILKTQYIQNTSYMLVWCVFTVSYEMDILILKVGNVNLN